MAASSRGIFISYRRRDSAGFTGRIYDRLSAHFGDEQIFLDVVAIGAGAKWAEEIEAEVSSCTVLLAIIGKSWLRAADRYGRRRLDIEEDRLRLEIETALGRDICVIPVLVGGAELPAPESLPASLRELPARQAFEMRHNRFHPDIEALIDELENAGIPPKPEAGKREKQAKSRAAEECPPLSFMRL